MHDSVAGDSLVDDAKVNLVMHTPCSLTPQPKADELFGPRRLADWHISNKLLVHLI